ncbi:MAG: membrane protein insertase YidC [Cycloclasticus sp. symbiont of Poecilosclerida sp. M]|nr:MAG: membrane protein insertase YidC [Cycloclasticus sp. symbiont of Poecilosclerida sp. M]
MDNQRTLLFAALAFVGVLIWQAWQEDYALPKTIPASVAEQGASQVESADVPSGLAADSASIGGSAVDAIASGAIQKEGHAIVVKTDVYDLEINTKGASIGELKLLTYPVEKGAEEVIHLLSDAGEKIHVVESGLISTRGSAPNHHALWTTKSNYYELSGDELRIPLYWDNGRGLSVVKTYVFKKGSYQIDVETTVNNNSSSSWTAREYLQLKRNAFVEKKKNSFIYTYTGAILYTDEERYQKIDFDDMADEDLSTDTKSGWVAMIQHYFGVAWAPKSTEKFHYYTKALEKGLYVIGAFSPNRTVAAGESTTFSAALFAGPKVQDQLEKTAPGMELMVDYGKLTIIAEPIFWLINFFHSLVGNWGVAIIMVTFSIKALFFKLSEKSYLSMAHMKVVQPRIVALKERFGDDKQKLNQAMMELYKTEKINPLGGCLPILVQIPVFISLYWVLLESVELRQAPFMLWMDNLSAPDPYFILPVLYGITMFLQQRLNPAPVDPMQKKMMQMLPLMFTGFFAFFPSGLVLYWIVNNTLTIIQQGIITRRVQAGKE